MTEQTDTLTYHATSFSQGRMDFAWEELSPAQRAQAYADWQAGKGLIGGNPHQRPGSDQLPAWGLQRPFFRALALDDERGDNGARLRAELATERPLEIEIGFGRGDFLLDRARRHPERLFLGYEVKTKAVRLLLQRLERVGLTNLWLSDDDVRFNLPRLLPVGRAAQIHILFPDPWWKEQHKAKRLFSPPFVDLLASALGPDGLLHVKTDVQEYGELVRYLVSGQADFSDHDEKLVQNLGPYAPTHREFWCQKRGLPVWTWIYRRTERSHG